MKDAPPDCPLVSLLVAAYNEERRIEACLKSLLAQTWPRVEVLFVDDGSTDRTRELAASFSGVRVLDQAHLGKAKAMNMAAREARGEIIFFTDADIEYAPDYVELMVAPILSGAEIGAAHGLEKVANPENPWAACWQKRAGLPPDIRIQDSPEQSPKGSIVFRAIRRDLFLSVGGFDDTGFIDDQSLAPKLGRNAVFVTKATCRHHNPDLLSEVYATGRWNAKSMLHLHGAKILLNFFPLFIPFRALIEGWRYRSWSMFVYIFVWACGVMAGSWRFQLGLEKHRGK
jgi:glycosyltransferase involved in cell wall biosynthesis